MNRFRTLAVLAIVPLLAAATAPDRMAPLSSYLMPRQAEIALARSAAPPSISGHASVLVLTPRGYVTAVAGDNGFTCFVDRAWDQPFDMKRFWNPMMHAPQCLNRQATRTVLPYTFKRTALALAGESKQQIMAGLTAAIASGALPTPAPGSISYMMSKHQRLGDGNTPWYPHVMFFAPKADGANDGAAWGANLERSPVAYDGEHHANPEPWAIFYIPVSHWSDGSPAPVYTGM